jgi:hypothetical protein
MVFIVVFCSDTHVQLETGRFWLVQLCEGGLWRAFLGLLDLIMLTFDEILGGNDMLTENSKVTNYYRGRLKNEIHKSEIYS